ncbi:hypothetical protein AGR1A_pAt20562 [Agrobacterium fabacearum CFBP 5771]|nr:hypothetical protein AGR1A_pAt20562 [Agrobacterium fabacearum CFBP 5771]
MLVMILLIFSIAMALLREWMKSVAVQRVERADILMQVPGTPGFEGRKYICVNTTRPGEFPPSSEALGRRSVRHFLLD